MPHAIVLSLACIVAAQLCESPCLAAQRAPDDPPARVSESNRDESRGTWRYDITSPLQKGGNTLEILLPATYDKSRAYRVVYVLPVEVQIGKRWGDGLMEIRKHGLHDSLDVIAAQMSFDTIPWFMDHATDPAVRQEAYLKQIVEIVEQRYRTPGTKEGRLLLGFSKSGWGAVAMVLRNPDFYGRAAAWDAPLMLREQDWTSFEIPKACGTQEQFAKYRLATLAAAVPESFKKETRLVILGEKNFGPAPSNKYAPEGHTQGFHALLDRLKIPHDYRNDLKVDHHWESGWVKPAMEALVGKGPK